MAKPERTIDDPQRPHIVSDPMPPDPRDTEPRSAANMPRFEEPGADRSGRGLGTTALIAAVLLTLAAIAWFAFGPSRTTITAKPEQPAPTEPAPSAAPVAPAPTTPAAPQSSAPAEPAPAPAPAAPAQ